VTKLIIRPIVRRDIAEIWGYTADHWGVEQADAYVRQIEAAIARAQEFPNIGSAVFGLPPAYRKMKSGSHRVVYRHEDDALIVVRVLHEREDVPDEIEDFW
jgi:toxin ParE1/3/4